MKSAPVNTAMSHSITYYSRPVLLNAGCTIWQAGYFDVKPTLADWRSAEAENSQAFRMTYARQTLVGNTDVSLFSVENPVWLPFLLAVCPLTQCCEQHRLHSQSDSAADTVNNGANRNLHVCIASSLVKVSFLSFLLHISFKFGCTLHKMDADQL